MSKSAPPRKAGRRNPYERAGDCGRNLNAAAEYKTRETVKAAKTNQVPRWAKNLTAGRPVFQYALDKEGPILGACRPRPQPDKDGPVEVRPEVHVEEPEPDLTYHLHNRRRQHLVPETGATLISATLQWGAIGAPGPDQHRPESWDVMERKVQTKRVFPTDGKAGDADPHVYPGGQYTLASSRVYGSSVYGAAFGSGSTAYGPKSPVHTEVHSSTQKNGARRAAAVKARRELNKKLWMGQSQA